MCFLVMQQCYEDICHYGDENAMKRFGVHVSLAHLQTCGDNRRIRLHKGVVLYCCVAKQVVECWLVKLDASGTVMFSPILWINMHDTILLPICTGSNYPVPHYKLIRICSFSLARIQALENAIICLFFWQSNSDILITHWRILKLQFEQALSTIQLGCDFPYRWTNLKGCPWVQTPGKDR